MSVTKLKIKKDTGPYHREGGRKIGKFQGTGQF